MGEGVSVTKSSRLGEGDEDIIIEHFICKFILPRSLYHLTSLSDDVVNTVVTSLSTLSRTQRRPAFGSIFLINNISYLRTHLLVNAKVEVSTLLSGPTREIISSNFRTGKAGYLDSNLTPLMQTISEDKDKGKSATKEKFTRFFDLLDEIIERHSFAKVLPDEKDTRDTLMEEVVKLVVPAFQRFTQRNTGKDFSKSNLFHYSYCQLDPNIFDFQIHKNASIFQSFSLAILISNRISDIKMTPQEVEIKLRGLYAAS
jgi:exocyst complex protein 7